MPWTRGTIARTIRWVPRNHSLTPAAKIFGDLLRSHRLAREMTQEDLAHRAEMDVSFISRMERGLTQPSIGMFIKIAEVLEIPAAKLMSEVESALSTKRGRGR